MYGKATSIAKQDCSDKQSPTRVVELFMAGDVCHAKQVIRSFCAANPCCVTVTPTTYIYSGGEESGFVVGIRNYPRFPSDSHRLQSLAAKLGAELRLALSQDSYMVVDHGDQTVWSTTRHGG